ncbi:MAG TPA: MarR family winged helix-turn-helix transcriptional regulator [Chloroflexota bacterium]|nr:MarR family winged helix-turn-helix transcriptional regulator [Chloroflexota bacterium]
MGQVAGGADGAPSGGAGGGGAPAVEDAFTPVERDAWGGLVVVQGRLRRRLDAALRDRHGLSHAEFEVLFLLSHAPQTGARSGRRLSELSAKSMLTLSGMSRLVERLVRAGLVARSVAPEDRRGAYARLTGAGWERFGAAQETEAEVARAHFLALYEPAELETLARLWRRFFAHDRALSPPPRRP